MATTYTAHGYLGKPGIGDAGWGATINATMDQLDGNMPICVRDFTSDAITAAVALAADGDTVFLPPGDYTITDTIAVTKRIALRGGFSYGQCGTETTGAVLVGTELTVLSFTKSFSMEGIGIRMSAAHADNIGVYINNGPSGGGDGPVNWVMKDCAIISPTASYGTLGKGIVCDFALKGRMEGVTVEGWGTGIELSDASNANAISGAKIRQNGVGLLIADTGAVSGADTCFLSGSTVEGNSTGAQVDYGNLAASQNHFENTLGSQINVFLGENGRYFSMANGYFGAAAVSDIWIDAGATISGSLFDILNAGITHNGTGTFVLIAPTISVSVAGTGPISRIDANGIYALQGLSAQGLVFSGYANIDCQEAITNTTGPLIIGSTDGVEIQNPGTGTVCVIDSSGAIAPMNTAAQIYSISGTPEGTLTAAKGSICLRTDGVGPGLYVKETGVGNTGWVAK